MTPCIYWLSGSYTPRIAKVRLMVVAYAREAVEGCCIFKAEEGFVRLITILNGEESAAMTMSEIEKLIREKLQEIGLELTEAKMNEGWSA